MPRRASVWDAFATVKTPYVRKAKARWRLAVSDADEYNLGTRREPPCLPALGIAAAPDREQH
jgi:hypothetical protein